MAKSKKKKIPTKPSEFRSERLDDQIGLVGSLDVDQIWSRMRDEFLAQWTRLQRAGIEGDELEAEMEHFIEGLSDNPLSTKARKSSTVATSQGRSAQLLTAADDGVVEYVIRSELLDSRTCDVCESLDGEAFQVGTPEYFANEPPAKCLGDENCRGLYIPVTVDVAS